MLTNLKSQISSSISYGLNKISKLSHQQFIAQISHLT